MKPELLKKMPAVLFLAACNILVFLIMFLTGDPEDSEYMLRHGALFYPAFFEGDLLPLFTSLFLHFGAAHLFSNMLSLCALGSVIERCFGSLRFLLIYFLSGVSGGIVSCFYHRLREIPAVCAGASGAVFGLAGALVVLALFGITDRYGIERRRVPMAVLLCVLVSMEGNVDTSAHAGGLIAGFLTALILLLPSRLHR